MYKLGLLTLFSARLLALGFLGFAGYHVYTAQTAGLPVIPADITGPVSSMGILFGFVFMGMAIAWFRERLGGWLIIFFMSILYFSELLWSGTIPSNELYMAMFGTGFLFVLSSAMLGGFGD
jgi:hypothetical protein